MSSTEAPTTLSPVAENGTHTNYSIVIDHLQSTLSVEVTFSLANLALKPLAIWRTHADSYFQKVVTISPTVVDGNNNN